ncbi:uncharacterized protein DUF2470 [Kribbella sp. VKM Ac-2527]|uniref:Uncharacterized protein DUF2470 n=1 Tax=Kribbella caucasensis TaxID=2512215 RepID=A0A4R6KJ19_9ACTN|nr:DUF2470 domain-containing protein [Kribbella sp. VKM Ac-2527]TDO51287.1 uncharacterized protein DUF2470 [Kribbella sp. VKM Ac-2527]
MTDPFTPDIVAAVLRHMNEDHAEHSLEIVRVLGARPDATSVRLTTVTPTGATFEATVPDADPVEVVIPWSTEITERPQFRTEFAHMYQRASAQPPH